MGLIAGDLKHLVYDIFEIDSFKSKMGDDKNIVVMSLSARTKETANDLMNILEQGYPFVLDADVTSGEQVNRGSGSWMSAAGNVHWLSSVGSTSKHRLVDVQK